MSTENRTETIGFGIIGTGMGGNRARMTLATEGAALRAVCDLRAETAQARGAEWDCDWTTSPAELMARDDVDVVGVFTPSGTHGDLAIAAAEAGKHVITTKPPEVTVARVNAMAAAARKAGVLLAVDYQSRYRTTCGGSSRRSTPGGSAVATGAAAGQSVPHLDVLHRRIAARVARDLAL